MTKLLPAVLASLLLALAAPITHPVRWKLGRYQGFNSYIGISDDVHAGVFVFVNADLVDPAVDSPDNVMRTELAEPILGDFFLANL